MYISLSYIMLQQININNKYLWSQPTNKKKNRRKIFKRRKTVMKTLLNK